MHIHTHVHTHTYTHTHIHTYTYTHIHTYIHTFTHTNTQDTNTQTNTHDGFLGRGKIAFDRLMATRGVIPDLPPLLSPQVRQDPGN